jgi:hypothetical protein
MWYVFWSVVMAIGCSTEQPAVSPVEGHSVEPKILKLIEKAAGKAPLKRKVAARKRVFEQEAKNDRLETLRITDEYGDVCAAVSISSQLAVTALHCISNTCTKGPLIGCKALYSNPGGAKGEATVVATSENDLLALLDLHQVQPKYGSICCDNPRAEDRVYTVSHPGGVGWIQAYGWMTRDPIPLEWVKGQATAVLVAEIPTKPGSSGGGLFDDQDRLVGVQIARWSPWTKDSGKAAFIQSNRIFNLAGRYCMQKGSAACIGLKCSSWQYDVWSFPK